MSLQLAYLLLKALTLKYKVNLLREMKASKDTVVDSARKEYNQLLISLGTK